MGVTKALSSLGLVLALAVAPTYAIGQSQATKTGSSSTTGVTAGQSKEGGSV